MSGRQPSEKQHQILRNLGAGAALVTGKRRVIEPLIKRGWVEGEPRDDNYGRYFAWVRITPDGLRALADGLEKWPWPEIGPKQPDEWVRECAKCGSTRWHQRLRPTTEPLPVSPSGEKVA